MPVEYKTITVDPPEPAIIDAALNAEAADGWRVHTVDGPGVYLLEKGSNLDAAPVPIPQAGTMPTGPGKVSKPA